MVVDSLNVTSSGFSSVQTIEVLGCFQNSITISELITKMSPLLLGFNCSDVATLMKSIGSSFTRMDILKATVNVTVALVSPFTPLYPAARSTFWNTTKPWWMYFPTRSTRTTPAR
jgi:hypothetical protein